MANHLDHRTFPCKPTTWLTFGRMLDLGTLPTCNGACAHMIPGTGRHKMVVCNNPNMLDEQVRISNVHDKARVPLGCYDRFWRAFAHTRTFTNYKRRHTLTSGEKAARVR